VNPLAMMLLLRVRVGGLYTIPAHAGWSRIHRRPAAGFRGKTLTSPA